MDPLSEVLRSVRLTGGIFLDARFTAPWSVNSKITPDDCRPFLATPAQVVAYHVLIEGRLLLFLDGESPVEVYASARGDRETGWLKGISDPQIGRALALIHGAISAPWTVERLAREAALSRSTFVERFTSLIGMPPIRYLTSWRLQAAKLQLKETSQSIAQIAYTVGYESEEAFSRAFKRDFGTSPARWRVRSSE